jgi:hypothetical protein
MFSPIRRSILYFAEWRFDMLVRLSLDAVRRRPIWSRNCNGGATHHPSCITPPGGPGGAKGRLMSRPAAESQAADRA